MNSDNEFYDDEILDYRYYFDLLKIVLFKYYKTIAGICTLSVIATLLYVQSQAPVYVSTVTLHVAPNDMAMFSFEQWMFHDDEKFQDTQIGILQSGKLMRRVVDELDLHKAGKLYPESFDAGVIASVRDFFSADEAQTDPEAISEPDAIRTTADYVSGLMSISKPPDREYSSLLNVSVRMADPVLAASTANTIAQTYIDLVFENEIESAKKNQQFLTDRLSVLREDLRQAEERLQQYRESQNIVVRSSGLDEVDEELAALSNRFFSAQEARLKIESQYQQVKDVNPASSAWEKLPAVANHPTVIEIQSNLFALEQRKGELSKRYGNRHNKMIAVNSEIDSARATLTNQVRDIIEGIRNEYELAVKIEEVADQDLSSSRGRKQDQGRSEFSLNELTQDVETKRQVYTIFLERLNQDGATGVKRNDNLRIVDPAMVPKAGQRTSLFRATVIALILSFGFCAAIGLFLEMTSNTLTTAEDVEKKLNTALLGYLPLIDSGNTEPGAPLREYIGNPHSRFSEALRTIRTSITLATLADEEHRRMLITSSQSSEGKTSVTLSLAAAFGQTAKVLVIDGDLRKPSVEKILNNSNHKLPGLSDIIAHAVDLDEAIQHHADKNFDVIHAGSRTIKPLELLSSPQFEDLMRKLDDRYDTILIDSPPCISVSDAYVLATQVNSIIFVAKSEEASVPLVRNCLTRFNQVDTPIAGILLNRVNLDAAHNLGRYQDYYDYRGYGDPIEAETEVETESASRSS